MIFPSNRPYCTLAWWHSSPPGSVLGSQRDTLPPEQTLINFIPNINPIRPLGFTPFTSRARLYKPSDISFKGTIDHENNRPVLKLPPWETSSRGWTFTTADPPQQPGLNSPENLLAVTRIFSLSLWQDQATSCQKWSLLYLGWNLANIPLLINQLVMCRLPNIVSIEVTCWPFG